MSRQVLLVGLESSLPSPGPDASAGGLDSSWSLTRIGNGTQALGFADQNEVDAVVVESQLPDMSGLRLLDEIMRRRPAAHRFLLLDLSRETTIESGISPAHFLLAKPFRPDELEPALERAARVSAWFGRNSVLQIIRRMRKVPSPPLLYYRIMAEWQSPSASLGKLGRLIASDQAASGRYLEMANASSAGLSKPLRTTDEAVAFFGVEVTASLLLLAHVCAQFDRISPYLFSVDELCRHSLATGRLARAIARAERLSQEMTDQAFMAGLLHDLGKMVLAANAPERYVRVQSETRMGLRTCWEAEQETFGLTHAEVGAWLAGIWGLPSPVVEAIGFHHQPLLSETLTVCPLDVVHPADLIEHELQQDVPSAGLDLSCLIRKGLADREYSWSELAHSLLLPALPEMVQERPLAA